MLYVRLLAVRIAEYIIFQRKTVIKLLGVELQVPKYLKSNFK